MKEFGAAIVPLVVIEAKLAVVYDVRGNQCYDMNLHLVSVAVKRQCTGYPRPWDTYSMLIAGKDGIPATGAIPPNIRHRIAEVEVLRQSSASSALGPLVPLVPLVPLGPLGLIFLIIIVVVVVDDSSSPSSVCPGGFLRPKGSHQGDV